VNKEIDAVYYKKVVNYLKRVMINPQDAEDVAQEFFLYYHETGYKKNKTWLVADFLREKFGRYNRRQYSSTKIEIPVEDLRILESIPHNDLLVQERLIISLIMAGHTNEEIANMAGVDKSRICQILQEITTRGSYARNTKDELFVVEKKTIFLDSPTKDVKIIKYLDLPLDEVIKNVMLNYIQLGFTQERIAKIMKVSVRTVRNYTRRLELQDQRSLRGSKCQE